uniref:Uncharacterized protein n=1 Tax=Leersia perrieri TaxID=77586 RepID=A0A0D9VIT9_9ORYZ
MQPGGQNPRDNGAPPGRQNNGAGFRQGGITGPNAPQAQHHHHQPAAAAPAPDNNITPQERASKLLNAGYLAAQYLVSVGVLSPGELQGRQPPPPLPLRNQHEPPFQGFHQQQGPRPQPPPPQNGGPIMQHRFPQHAQAPGPSTQQQRFVPGRPFQPQRQIGKRPVARPFQNQGRGRGRGRGRAPFPPPGQGRAPFRPPLGAAAAAAPGMAAGVVSQGAVPGAGGGGFDATATAGAPSSSRQPLLPSGGAAHGQTEKGQSGEYSNSGGPL